LRIRETISFSLARSAFESFGLFAEAPIIILKSELERGLVFIFSNSGVAQMRILIESFAALHGSIETNLQKRRISLRWFIQETPASGMDRKADVSQEKTEGQLFANSGPLSGVEPRLHLMHWI
jgi:hypothetical protein